MAGEDETVHGLRPITYCLVPRDLAPKLHDLLRRHFHDDPGTEVVVERRDSERRDEAERRAIDRPAGHTDRRRILGRGGRRVGERRAALVGGELRGLPRRARPHADRIMFVERLEPSEQRVEDLDTARAITRLQSGERDAFAILYMRYFDRVYSYLKVVFGDDDHTVEDAVQEVFVRVLAALPRYERRERPFRAWLFTIVRNHVLTQLERQGRVDLTDPAVLDSWREGADESASLGSLDWITDRELMLFIERLPLPQRQVLVLRFMVGFSHREVAAILGRSESDVSVAQSRALRFLRERLTAVGRGPLAPRPRDQMRRPLVKARVARRRRTALLGYN